MAQKTLRTASSKPGKASAHTKSAAATKTRVKVPHNNAALPLDNSQEVVVFTSFDGTMREVGDLPLPLDTVLVVNPRRPLFGIIVDGGLDRRLYRT